MTVVRDIDFFASLYCETEADGDGRGRQVPPSLEGQSARSAQSRLLGSDGKAKDPTGRKRERSHPLSEEPAERRKRGRKKSGEEEERETREGRGERGGKRGRGRGKARVGQRDQKGLGKRAGPATKNASELDRHQGAAGDSPFAASNLPSNEEDLALPSDGLFEAADFWGPSDEHDTAIHREFESGLGAGFPSVREEIDEAPPLNGSGSSFQTILGGRAQIPQGGCLDVQAAAAKVAKLLEDNPHCLKSSEFCREN
mmetsp:Transcript_32750/g.84596  ORF Transcript_32750/g.84596 Transcript_32750/m.84596 type:complete len:256 (-) Transcript_32750:1070-1837(-)